MVADIGHDKHTRDQHDLIATTKLTPRISRLKARIQAEPRFMSVEQALIITESYLEHPDEPRVLQRAHALARACQITENERTVQEQE